MAFTRLQRVGATAAVLAVVSVGATALVVQASTNPSQNEATQGPAATDAATRATPTAAPAPVLVAAPAATPSTPAVQAQLDYALAHWDKGNYNTAEYGVLGINDCVNFASQTLIARGWQMDATWNSPRDGDAYSASAAWRSSTALMHYLAGSGKVTALTDDQRDQVKLGDIVQFDWDNSGDRDHTGVVSRIEGSGDDIVIYYAGHTEDSDYRSVDFAITERHPGGTAYYWSVP
ncbi:amidase domain-containing protein [Cryobacterium psychrophilum]|uniref:amidase domain-containing protein n=1 Tax=Cryobacterium psychrophilum TaxID=41988 RepID=UPI0010D59AEA|nr:amidase domain-containing protein [Cryobacterium psychrophilum]TDW30337.1 putative amidase-like protein [Cryobacterium psychrophilum]